MLVGPSGCGKTTTLKMINRLVEPTSGRITVDGEDISTVDPVSCGAAWATSSSRSACSRTRPSPPTSRRCPGCSAGTASDRRPRRRAAGARRPRPGTYGGRYPHQLSGGQRQRVGVARALAADPPVLLMDEPFGAVDPITRDRLQDEFLRLQAELRKTVVFVTHDVDEAVRLGDRIAVLAEGGRLEQYAPPAEVLARPPTPFVADFVGADRGIKRGCGRWGGRRRSRRRDGLPRSRSGPRFATRWRRCSPMGPAPWPSGRDRTLGALTARCLLRRRPPTVSSGAGARYPCHRSTGGGHAWHQLCSAFRHSMWDGGAGRSVRPPEPKKR